MVYTKSVEIKHCKRCECDWCFRGAGRPLRCGKCKTPYWDVGVGNAGIRDGVGRVDSGGGQDNRADGVDPGPFGNYYTTPTKICRSCESEMIQVRGLWACPELTCSLCGQQQGRVN